MQNTHMNCPSSPILWQNKDQTITLLDIPRSISAAQGTADDPCLDVLISTNPPEIPFLSQEPSTEKAKAKLASNTVGQILHTEIRNQLQRALDEVRKYHTSEWCFPRCIASEDPITRLGKRKLDEHDSCARLGAENQPVGYDGLESSRSSDLKLQTTALTKVEAEHDTCWRSRDEDIHFQANCTPRRVYSCGALSTSAQKSDGAVFHVPPYSTFCQGDIIKNAQAFHAAVRNQAVAHDTRKKFDVMILDPPWPNRSVRRSKTSSTAGYSVAASLKDVKRIILKTDLDVLMESNCLVGIWVTNSPSVRSLVLDHDGIFAQWGIKLEEEWVWLKTTLHGEPIWNIDSAWRKPYEFLLLGRNRRMGYGASERESTCPNRRTIIAVPDLHSRKPCLKELIEPLMPSNYDYRALEVFSRHLVAGWWSWGDECAKFNADQYWTRATKCDQE